MKIMMTVMKIMLVDTFENGGGEEIVFYKQTKSRKVRHSIFFVSFVILD